MSRFISFFIICIFLIEPVNSFSQSDNVIFLRNVGFGFGGGVNYPFFDYTSKIGFEGKADITYLFPIKLKSFGLGIKGEFQYGAFNVQDRSIPNGLWIHHNLYLGGLTIYDNGENTSVAYNIMGGMINSNFTDNSGSYNNSLVFILKPSIQIKAWGSRTSSFDIEVAFGIPFTDYIDNVLSTPYDFFAEVKIGLSFFTITVYDTDEDGVEDKFDQCPGTPKNEKADAFGCSLSQLDSDNDGLHDDVDKCSNTAPEEINLIDSNGCGPSQRDTDRDGKNDFIDKCVNTPSTEISEINREGCGPSERDTDEDGVSDLLDKCPQTSLPCRNVVDSSGCAGECETNIIDADLDGIPNDFDSCDYDAETYNYWQDDDGCPEVADYNSTYILSEGISFFEVKDSALAISSVGESILSGVPSLLISTYEKTEWIIVVKTDSLALTKANIIKNYLETRLNAANRLTVETQEFNAEEIQLLLNTKKAKEIITNKFKVR